MYHLSQGETKTTQTLTSYDSRGDPPRKVANWNHNVRQNRGSNWDDQHPGKYPKLYTQLHNYIHRTRILAKPNKIEK